MRYKVEILFEAVDDREALVVAHDLADAGVDLMKGDRWVEMGDVAALLEPAPEAVPAVAGKEVRDVPWS